MARLCSDCINGCPGNIDRNKSSDSIPDPIYQALRKLQAKIKVLEIQRNDETGKLHMNYSMDLVDDINSNQNNANIEPLVPQMCNHSTIIVPGEDQQQRTSNDSVAIDIEEVSCQLEKSLASDALKMAEKRCALLESQLIAMKRLFLRKISKGAESTMNDPIKPLKHAKKSTARETFHDAKLMTDVDSLYSFNCDAVDDIVSDSDSELFNLSLPGFESKECQKEGFHDRIDRSAKKKTAKSFANTSRNASKSKNDAYPMSLNRGDQPFILGCSTSTSYNANVKKRRPRRNLTSNCNNGRQLAESSINNLRSIYSELCCEYEQLLNKKVKILDLVARTKGKELLEQRQQLNEITQSLPLKRQQIHKMKTLITNFNDTFRCDYPNIRWDI